MASGETNLEFKVQVGGLNELGKLRASVLKLKAGTIEVKDASMALSNAFPKLEGTAKDLQKIFFGQATTMKMLVRNQKVFRNEIKNQVGNLKAARKETQLGSAAWRRYSKEIAVARKQMSGLPLRKLGTDLKNVTNLMLKNAKNLQWVGRQMIVGITAPLGIMMRTAMQSFEAFEKQFVRTKKILGLQGTAADSLRQKMHELSTELGVSRSIVAALTADFAQMGKKMLGGTAEIQETAAEYAELTLQLEHVGQVSAQVGRDFIANLAGIIQDADITKVNELGESFVDTGNKIDYVRGLLAKFNLVENTTALSLKDLAEAFPQVSPAAKAAGIDLVFLSGIIGGMRQSGLNATESAHALKFALQRMIAPTAAVAKIVATFGSGVEGFHSDLGIGNMMLFKLAENMELLRSSGAKEEGALQYLGALVGKRQASRIYATTLALGSFQENLEAVGKIFTDLGDQDSVWASIGHDITNAVDDKALKKKFERAFSTEDSVERFLLDIHNSKIALEGESKTKLLATERSMALNRALEGLSPPMKAMVIDFMGATSAGKQFAEEFKQVMGGPAMQMQLVRGDIRNLLLDIGTQFFDTVKSIIPKIREWIQAMQNMSPTAKQAILVIGLLAAALGPLAFIFGQAGNAIASIGSVAAAVLPKMRDLTRSLMLSKAMAGESLPLIRRFGTGWIDTGARVRKAGRGMRDTFKALRADSAIALTGFNEAVVSGGVTAGAGVTGAAAGAAAGPMHGPFLTDIDQSKLEPKDAKRVNRQIKASEREIRKARQATQSTLKNSAEDIDRWSARFKKRFTETNDSAKKFAKGFKQITTQARIPAGQPGAGQFMKAETARPSVVKLKQAALRPVKAVGEGLTKLATSSKKVGLDILKNINSPMKILRLAGIASATGFKLSWTIALKAVRKAMLKAGPIALLVILASVIMYVVSNLDKFKKAAGGSFDTLKKAWNNIIGTFKELGRIFFEIFEDIFGKKSKEGGKAVEDSMSAVSSIITKVSEVVLKFSIIFKKVFLTILPPLIKGLLIVIRTVVRAIGAVLGFLGKHWQSIAKVIIKVVYWIVKIIEFFLDVTFRVVQGVILALRGLAKVFFWLVNNAILPLLKMAAKGFNMWLEIILWVYRQVADKTLALLDVIKPVFNWLIDQASKVGQVLDFLSGGKLGWDFEGFELTDEINNLRGTVDDVFNTIDEKKDNIFDKIDGVEIGEGIVEAVDNGLSSVSDTLSTVIHADLARAAEDALEGAFSGVAETFAGELHDGWMSWLKNPEAKIEAENLNAAIAQEAAVAYEKALISVAVNWVSKVKSKFQKEMKKIADSAMKAFNAYAKVYLAAYDSRTAAVHEQIKAEKELTKTVEYETARREMISRMALDKENFLRNRALALYEGRIEDARNLTVKFRISNDASEKNVVKLDTGRAQDLLDQKRQALLAEIQVQKAAATERIQFERDALNEELAMLQEKLPQKASEWAKYVDDVNNAVSTGMENAFGKDAAAAKSIEEFAQIVDDELRGKFGDLFDDAGVVDKKVTNVGPIVTREAETWTETVGKFATDSNAMMEAMFVDVETAWKRELEWEKWAMETALGREGIIAEIAQMIKDLEDLKTLTEEEMQAIKDSVLDNLYETATGAEEVATSLEESTGRMNDALNSVGRDLAPEGTDPADFKFFDPSSYVANQDYTYTTSQAEVPTGFMGSWDTSFNTGISTLETPGWGLGGAGRIPGGFEIPSASDFIPGISLSDSEKDREEGWVDKPTVNLSTALSDSEKDREWGWTAPDLRTDREKYGDFYGDKPSQLTGHWDWTEAAKDILDWTFGSKYRFNGGAVKAQYGKYLGGFQSSMVPVMAHGGEYIMNARAVQNIGLSKLESMNHSRNYQGGGGGGTNIFVENFIGEPEWFEGMMGEYNVSVAPKNERSRGLESRKISSMADNNRRGRV